MYNYRIKKYNPKFRDEFGRYTKDEWTSIYDIGKIYDKFEFSKESYSLIEDSYINSILKILEIKNISSMTIKNLVVWRSVDQFILEIKSDKFQDLYTLDMIKLYERLEEGINLNRTEIGEFCRLLLREDIGGLLVCPRKLKIHIGYDYLMGIESSTCLDKIITEIEEIGLFVERF